MNSITNKISILLKYKIVKFVLSTSFILLVWGVSASIVNDSYILPNFIDTADSLFKIVFSGKFYSLIFTSIIRVIFGMIIGLILGLFFAALCHYFEFVSVILSPVFSILKSTPIACIITLLWISMTYNQLTVFVVVIMVMPIIWQNVLDAFRSIDKNLAEVSDAFEFSFIKKIKVLIIPSLLPYLIPALITSVGLAWKSEIAAEIVTYTNIGKEISNYKYPAFDTASIFAWTALIICISILFEKGTKYLLRRLDDAINKKHR